MIQQEPYTGEPKCGTQINQKDFDLNSPSSAEPININKDKLFQPKTKDDNKKVTNKEYPEKVEKEIDVSDDFNDTSYKLGKIEAKLEAYEAGQVRLEASIAKISEDIGNILTNVESKINDKFNVIELKIDNKLSVFETKIEKSAKENNRWVFGIAITIIGILFANLYFTVSNTKTSTSQPNIIMMPYNNIPQAMERANPPIPSNVAPAPSTPQENHTP